MILQETISKYVCDACGTHSTPFQETPVEGWVIVFTEERGEHNKVKHYCNTCGNLFEYTAQGQNYFLREIDVGG